MAHQVLWLPDYNPVFRLDECPSHWDWIQFYRVKTNVLLVAWYSEGSKPGPYHFERYVTGIRNERLDWNWVKHVWGEGDENKVVDCEDLLDLRCLVVDHLQRR